jgi:hypothetical protein
MKTFSRILILAGVLTLAMGLASAQCSEPMEAKVKNFGTNIYNCPDSGNTGSPACGIFYRFYSDDTGSTGGANPGVDGNPIFQTGGTGSYTSDIENSQNVFGGAPHPCGRYMYNIWDSQQGAGTGDHAGYYGAQSNVIEAAEQGNPFAECGGTRFVSCFAALGGDEAVAVDNAPQGTVGTLGGMAPIPVPTVSASTADTVTLSWNAAANFHPTPAAGGDPGTGPNPITGVALYVYEDTGILDSRAVTDAELDGGARLLGEFATGTTSTVVDLTTDITPGTGTFIPVIKVTYAADPTDGPVDSLFWSANGPVVRVNDALYTEVVNFEATYIGKVRGNSTTHVSWETVSEDGLDGFELFRSTTSLEGPWVQVGDFLLPNGSAGEGAVYGVDDSFKAKGAKSVWYRLVIHDSGRTPRPHGPISLSIFK